MIECHCSSIFSLCFIAMISTEIADWAGNFISWSCYGIMMLKLEIKNLNLKSVQSEYKAILSQVKSRINPFQVREIFVTLLLFSFARFRFLWRFGLSISWHIMILQYFPFLILWDKNESCSLLIAFQNSILQIYEYLVLNKNDIWGI
jgi:hypothetical protein